MNKKYYTEFNTKGIEEYIKKVPDDIVKILDEMEPKINKLDISNVESKNLDRNKPLLQFEDYDKVIENICNVVDLEDGLSKMKKIFKDSDFEKHFYSRVIEHDDYYKIDYGSHHCFFIVTKEVL